MAGLSIISKLLTNHHQNNKSDISQHDLSHPKKRPPGTSFSLLDNED